MPSFTQISQLTCSSKLPKEHQQKHYPVHETVNFFNKKTKEPASCSKTNSGLGDSVWNDLQYDTIWENVIDYSYSLCNTNSDHQQKCFQLYTKARRKSSKKLPKAAKSDLALSGRLSNVKTISTQYEHLVEAKVNSENRRNQETLGISTKQGSSKQAFETDLEISHVYEQLQVCGDLLNIAETAAMDLTYQCPERERLSVGMLENTMEKPERRESSEKSVTKAFGNELNVSGNHNACSLKMNSPAECSKKISKQEISESSKHLKCAKRQLCPIEVNEHLTNELQVLPGPNWTSDEDSELVRLLVNSLGGATNKGNTKVSSEQNPKL